MDTWSCDWSLTRLALSSVREISPSQSWSCSVCCWHSLSVSSCSAWRCRRTCTQTKRINRLSFMDTNNNQNRSAFHNRISAMVKLFSTLFLRQKNIWGMMMTKSLDKDKKNWDKKRNDLPTERWNAFLGWRSNCFGPSHSIFFFSIRRVKKRKKTDRNGRDKFQFFFVFVFFYLFRLN